MATIDIGSVASDRGSTGSAKTLIDKNNPANKTGKITSIEIWANTDLSNVEVATFFVVSGNNLSTRDTHTIGSVTAGSKQTFSGLDIDVEAGDYIGICWSAGLIEADSFGTGFWYSADSSDQIPCTNYEFDFLADRTISLYGTGVLIKSISGAFSFSGSLNKLTKKMVVGTVTFTGNILRKIYKSLTGAFGLSGTVSTVKTIKKALSGILSFTSSLTVWIYYTWVGVTKAIGEWGAVSKVTDDCTKVSKEKGEFSKVEKE